MQLYFYFTCGFITIVFLHTETGKTVSRAISSLQEHGVKVEKITLVTLFATPPGENFKVKLTGGMCSIK